jgi:hypothetical protein
VTLPFFSLPRMISEAAMRSVIGQSTCFNSIRETMNLFLKYSVLYVRTCSFSRGLRIVDEEGLYIQVSARKVTTSYSFQYAGISAYRDRFESFPDHGVTGSERANSERYCDSKCIAPEIMFLRSV